MSYIGISDNETSGMLDKIGIGKIDDLFKDIPEKIRLKSNLKLPEAISELELKDHIHNIIGKNTQLPGFLGAGIYRHYIPAVINELASRSEFYTAYTPYQPEVSQGTLAVIFEFQTMMSRLTGMEITNASMYDGATACAESIHMSCSTLKKNKALICNSLHPHYQQVLKTYAASTGTKIQEFNSENGSVPVEKIEGHIDSSTACLVIQSPNFFGIVEDIETISGICEKHGIHLIVVINEALSLGILKSPGECGADIVCGDAQAFGNPPAFGGPLLGFISAKKEFMRRMPGRLVGMTTDSDGNRAFVLTLQTREQHIRREKATSNICTNEGLLLLRAVIYLSMMGPKLRQLAELNHRTAVYLKNRLLDKGFEQVFDRPFFNEFAVKFHDAKSFVKKARMNRILPGICIEDYYPEHKNSILFCATELHSLEMIDSFIDSIETMI